MRRSFQDHKIITDNGVFLGVSLGWDFVAEHEWGIKGIRNHFGIDTDKMGIKGRTITNGDVVLVEDEKMCVLTSRTPWNKSDVTTIKDYIPHDLTGTQKSFDVAWDENDFCIVSTDKEITKNLKDLKEQFEKKNIAIAKISSDLPAFSNSSLCLLIVDRLPKEVSESMYRVDKKAKDLVEYEKKIGITKLKEKVKGSGYRCEKYFMACSPSWIDYENKDHREELKKKLNTKYDVRFWVNYSDDDSNFGWYIAEDIIKWLSTPGLKLKSLNKK